MNGGAHQRRTAVIAAVAGLALAAFAAVEAGAAPLPAGVVWAVTAAMVALRPRGHLPLLAFALMMGLWAVTVPHPSLWAVAGAAGLVTAHAGLAVVAATQQTSVVPRAAQLRLVVRSTAVIAAASAAAVGILAHHSKSSSWHTVVGVTVCLLLATWIGWQYWAPAPSGRFSRPQTRTPARHAR